MNIAAGGGVPLSKSGIYPDILETFTISHCIRVQIWEQLP